MKKKMLGEVNLAQNTPVGRDLTERTYVFLFYHPDGSIDISLNPVEEYGCYLAGYVLVHHMYAYAGTVEELHRHLRRLAQQELVDKGIIYLDHGNWIWYLTRAGEKIVAADATRGGNGTQQ